jgi:hypothetical protein
MVSIGEAIVLNVVTQGSNHHGSSLKVSQVYHVLQLALLDKHKGHLSHVGGVQIIMVFHVDVIAMGNLVAKRHQFFRVKIIKIVHSLRIRYHL